MIVKIKIKNRIYEKLINYAFEKSDAIMFVSRKDGFSPTELEELDNTIENIKMKFSDSILKTRTGGYWVFTKVGNQRCGLEEEDPPGYDELFEVLFLKTNQSVKEYMLTNKNLYQWLNPKYPEDISFFKNGYCWLYSVAHEEMCEIYCENIKEYEYLKSLGIKFFENKFTPTPKENLYYEDYNIKD